MSRTLKVAVIGTGGISRTHMPGWSASPHTEVVAASDVYEPAVVKFGEDFNIGRVTTRAEEIIGDPDIDIVDICTPNMYHGELAIAALNAGKHVICEKPLAPTPAEIRRMIEARDRSGKLLMTAQHFRFRGSSKAMKAEIGTGVLGDIYHARSWMLRRYIAPTRPGFILKEHSGGGPTIDIGVHILDLTLWFMGNPEPVSVTGVARAELAHQPGMFTAWAGGNLIPPEYDVEDFAAAFVRFANGATLMLEVSWLLHHDTPGEDMQMWLYGTRAGCHWPKCEVYESNLATRQQYNKTLKLTADTMEPHALECVEFAQAIVDGAPSPVPAEQSLQVMTILDGIYRSQQTGGEVRL
ncbi:MAG: putative oxidoreductase YcjS [Chloroflexi bacterium ADurb.Bin325]|nr:MAG: putative oxidoreductase YcjS [Chloroflexi bacterium ADurb.Bin325]